MYTTQSFPTRKQIALDIKNGVLSSHTGITLRGMIAKKENEVIAAKKERENAKKEYENTMRLKKTYQELLPIINQNIQSLKSSLGITEAHITWGNRSIKKKYSTIKTNILNKIREQLLDKRHYENMLQL